MRKTIVERDRPQMTKWRTRTACLITKAADTDAAYLEHVWNVMTHAQKPDLVLQRNGRVHLNQRGSHFIRLLAVEECGSAGRPCSEVQCES